MHGLGRENDLGGDVCVRIHDQHDVHGVHGEEQMSVRGFERVQKSVLCQLWMSGHCENGVWSVK